MAKISTISTQAPNSTSRLLGNVGTTSKTFDVEQLLGVPFTAEGDMLIGDSSFNSTRLAVGTSGSIMHISTVGIPAWFAPGTTGQHLRVGSSDGELQWSSLQLVPTTAGISSGAILHFSTAGVVSWLAAGTTGQVLQVGSSAGELVWSTARLVPSTATITSGAILHISTLTVPAWLAAGTTGQYLSVGTSAGELTWTSAQLVPTTVGASSGALLHISSAGTPAWLAPGTTGQYLTVKSSAGELGWTSERLSPSTVGVTSGAINHISTAGLAAWLAAGTTGQYLRMGTSAGELEWSSVSTYGTTAGGKLVTLSSVTAGWIDDDWSVSIPFTNGSASLTTSIKRVVLVPFAAGIESVELMATTGNITSGSFGVDIYVEDFSSTPASSNSKITDSSYVKISSGNQRSTAEHVNSSWTTAIAAGDYITVEVVDTSSGVTFCALSIQGRKLSTV